MLQTILLVAIILVSLAMTALVLLQRSEGGALGMGGGPSGFMTARGAGNLLTKSTWILAALFFILAISLTVAGNISRGSSSGIDADAVGALVQPTAPPTEGTEPGVAPPPVTAPDAAPAAPTLDDLNDLAGSEPAQ
jgi:preprotein translocase subunit SecG